MFAERHHMVLPRFVDGGLLKRITGALAKSEFIEWEDKDGHRVFARELRLEPHTPIPRLFHLLLNNPLLFAAIQKLVDCGADRFSSRKDIDGGRVSCFSRGRCFKFMPGRDHFDSWHRDTDNGRLVGVSVNLESDPTAAGGIEIRLRHRGSTVHRAVPGFGDAVLFRIAPDLEHRGLPPAGAVPRCTFAGWFLAGKDYRESLGIKPREVIVPAAEESKQPGAAESPTAAR